MKREKLANFMNISVRTYSNWKNNEHKNIILILRSIFKDEQDIFLWTKYKIIPQYKYFKNQNELIDKYFRKRLCKVLGIGISNYYYWKEGKRSNIINLFIQIFKNSDNVNYWLQNNKFEIIIDSLKINNYVKYLEHINDNKFCTDSFINGNSSFFFKSININDFKNYLTISINCNNIDSKKNIKYQIINSIELSDNIDGNSVINEYKKFIDTLNKVDDYELKQLFHKSIIYSMFIYSIKNTDLNLFIKLFLLITIKLDLISYFKYLDIFLKYEREKLYSELKSSNNNLNLKETQLNILANFFVKIISSINTLELNNSFSKKLKFILTLKEMSIYYKIKESELELI